MLSIISKDESFKINWLSFFLLLLLIPLQDCYTQNDESFFFPPSLELVLDGDQWGRTGQTYNEAMWNPQLKKVYNSSKKMSISIECNLVEYLTVSQPDSLITITENFYKYSRTAFTKTKINDFILFTPEYEGRPDRRVKYVAVGLHPDGYYCMLNFSTTNAERKEFEEEIKKILRKSKLISPKDIDKKMGLPWSPVLIDSVYNSRLNRIRRKYRGYYTPEKLEEELKKITRKDLVPEIDDAFTNHELFNISRNVKNGTINFEELLDYYILDIKSKELAYYSKYLGGNHGEFIDLQYLGVKNQLTEVIGPNFNFSKNLYADSFRSCTKENIIYWNATKEKESNRLLVYSYTKENEKWNTFYKIINTKDVEDPYIISNDLDQCECSTKDFIIIKSSPLNYLVGNRSNSNTEFSNIEKSNFDPTKYNVQYHIGDFDNLHGNAVRFRQEHLANISDSITYLRVVNSSIKEMFEYSKIQQDEKLKSKIKSSWTSVYQTGGETPEAFEKRKEGIVERKFIEKYLYDAPLEKRLYTSYFMYSDMDKDGFSEVFYFSVSNGDITEIKIMESTENGVEEFKNYDLAYDYIKKTNECKIMISTSLDKYDLLIEK